MRALQICEACRRQLDTTGLAPGISVRCECGAQLSVRTPTARAPRALRCSACGGALRDGARQCEYCSSEVTLDELRLDSVCPDCGARMSSGARYCMECGLAIEPQARAALPASAHCPRCRSCLNQRRVGAEVYVECGTCAGLWLAAAQLDQLCERAESEPSVLYALSLQQVPARAIDTSPVRYLKCVRCAEPMHRRNFGGSSGLIVDVCKDHGVWLDHGELERAIAFARSGGLLRARAREFERLRAEAERAAVPPALPAAESALSGPGVGAGSEVELDLATIGRFLARAASEFLRSRTG
jgi:Zn-finger nucleic acid-binding protein